jgi:hypothetical protein
VLEDDVDRLYDGWFIETCEEWLVPYLAELVGLAEVPPDLGTTVSRRALVANTVAYRRRKGTLAAIEQVARDVTGWPTKAVEYRPLLVTTTHVNHVRLDRTVGRLGARGRDRPGHGRLPTERPARGRPARAHRRGAPHGQPQGPLRHPQHRGVPVLGPGREIGAPGTDPLDPDQGAESGWSRTRVSSGWHHVDPLARSTPLLAPPAREASIETLATEPVLPVPLRPRRLLRLLQDARAVRSSRPSCRSGCGSAPRAPTCHPSAFGSAASKTSLREPTRR